MSTYKAIFGKTIKHLSSDPDNSTYEGQIWYNTTEGKFKTVVATGAWSSASPTNNAKQRPGGCGTQTAGLACGGSTAPPASGVATTEEYNGSGWSTASNINTARGNTKLIGTQTAAVFSGKGSPSVPYAGTTELYDGTTWTTNPNSANDTYNYRSGCGTQTAALLSGGNYPPTNRAAGNEEFDGTSFSEGGDLPQKQSSQGQAGTQTAAINSFGATNNPVPGNSGDGTNAISLEYDGSTWTTGPDGNSVVPLSGYAMGSGTQTDAIFAGGPPVNSCKYDGTTFSVGPALATAQPSSAHASTSASATWIAHGSPVPSVGTDTQEFNFTANTVTAAAWSSGTALPSARFNGASAGTTTAGIIAGGELAPGTRTGETVYFDGSAWTAQPATLSPAPNADGVKMAGTQTAAILNSFRGGGSPGPAYTDARSWNGSTWTSIPSTSQNHSFSNLFRNGTPSAATTIGGDNEVTPGVSSNVEEYNGTSWAAETALPAGRGNMAAFGTPTAGVIAGGALGPGTPNRTATALEYDGSSWTTTGSMTAAATVVGGGGTQTTGIIFGGYNPTPAATANTNTYDGTVFSTAPSMATARGGLYSIGSSSGAYAAGGNPPVVTTVEEFSPETTAINIESVDNS